MGRSECCCNKVGELAMTEEELKREGKYSDKYQEELAGCYAIMLVVTIACAVVYGVAKVVTLIKGG